MKKIKFLSLIILVFVTSIVYSQQSKKQTEFSEMLIGSWKLDTMEIKDFQVPEEMMPFVTERYNKMKEEALFVFNEDFTYFSKGLGSEMKGVWSISRNGKYIIVSIEGREKEERTEIISITPVQLIMTPAQSSSSNSKFTLSKIVE